MSQVSPYARTTAERGVHRLTTGLLLGLTAATFLVVYWITNSVPAKSDAHQPQTDDASFATSTWATRIYDVIDADANNWSAQIDAIAQELPNENSSEVTRLRNRLSILADQLEKHDLSAHSQTTIQTSLDSLRQQMIQYRVPTSVPTVNAEAFVDEVEANAQRILDAQRQDTTKAVEDAERLVRSKWDSKIRKVRLEISDHQDEAADLRRQITRMQREQSEFQAKTERIAAMRRDMADVTMYLSPFTAPGYLQPKSDSNAWDAERTVDPQPVSLFRLERLGALEPTLEGLERLYIFGGSKGKGLHNSRPLGAFPQYDSFGLQKPNLLQAVKRAQQLLREHGQALVDEQLLTP